MMRAWTTRRRVVMIGTGSALVLVLLLTVFVGPSSLPGKETVSESVTGVSTTGAPSSSSSTLASSALTAACLLPVGAGDNLTRYGYENTTGVMLTLASGATTFFPQNQCPQPVSNRSFEYSTGFGEKIATNYYQLALAAVSNPRFVSLENGTTFLFSEPESAQLSTTANGNGVYGIFNGSNDYSFSVFFFRYSNLFLPYPGCGHFNVTAGIEVDFFAPYLQQYVNGSPTPGNWNVTNPSIEALSSNKIAFELDACVIA